MPLQGEQRKHELVESVAGLVDRSLPVAKADALARVIRQFYAHVPPEDVLSREPADLYGAATSLWAFAEQREPGRAKVRVFNPRSAEQGWNSPRTIVEIVNDDMPFLVDSVTAALNSLDLVVHLVIHPIVQLRRDATGQYTELLDGNGSADGIERRHVLRESLMHVEISEQSDKQRREAIATMLLSVLDDVRGAVTDWPRMRKALAGTLEELENRTLPLPTREVNEIAGFLRWLDEDNFTFLGFREYQYASTTPDAPWSFRRPGSASCATTTTRCSTGCAISRRCRPKCRSICARSGC